MLDELRDAWQHEARAHRAALIGIAALAVGLRLYYILQPIRYDEAVTYLEFVRLPWAEAISRYTYPNNHVFHTALAKASIALFGDTAWALRAPAFVAGVLLVPATYAVGRGLYGPRAALVGAAVVATSGILILYSTNARGYSMIVLAFLLLVSLALRLRSGARWATRTGFVVIAALGLWTIPVMLFPLVTIGLWVVLLALVEKRSGNIKTFAWMAATIAVLTILLYMPVVGNTGLASLTSNKFVTAAPWPTFFAGWIETMSVTLRSWSLGVPPLASLLLLACAIVALARHRALCSTPVGLPLAAFVACSWLLIITHRAPFARTWLWMVPMFALLAGAGLIRVLDGNARTARWAQRQTPLLAMMLALVFSASLIWSRGVLITRDTGTYPDAEQVTAIFRQFLRNGDRVVAPIPANAPLAYHMARAGLDSFLTLDESRAVRLIVIVNDADGQTLESILPLTLAGDTTRFRPRASLELPHSKLVAFERVDAPK